jgi:hypothetical protein
VLDSVTHLLVTSVTDSENELGNKLWCRLSDTNTSISLGSHTRMGLPGLL